jgi:hypothetical protein
MLAFSEQHVSHDWIPPGFLLAAIFLPAFFLPVGLLTSLLPSSLVTTILLVKDCFLVGGMVLKQSRRFIILRKNWSSLDSNSIPILQHILWWNAEFCFEAGCFDTKKDILCACLAFPAHAIFLC